LHPDSAGIIWQANQQYEIKWYYTEKVGQSVKIELFNNATLDTILSDSTENDGSFVWLIPENQKPAPSYKIKITSKKDTTYFDFSDNSFAIQEPSHIIVTHPDSTNIILQAGLICNIKWMYISDPGKYVKIDLYKGSVHDRIIT